MIKVKLSLNYTKRNKSLVFMYLINVITNYPGQFFLYIFGKK